MPSTPRPRRMSRSNRILYIDLMMGELGTFTLRRLLARLRDKHGDRNDTWALSKSETLGDYVEGQREAGELKYRRGQYIALS
jgi:hypothetical protein